MGRVGGLLGRGFKQGEHGAALDFERFLEHGESDGVARILGDHGNGLASDVAYVHAGLQWKKSEFVVFILPD
jgi:hypothetical protein